MITTDYTPRPGSRHWQVTLLTDPNSWIAPWAQVLANILAPYHETRLETEPARLGQGTLAFFLGLTRIITADLLAGHALNLVIHESDLPLGRGWSPVAWQILEGKGELPVTLFAATAEPDAGPVFLRDSIILCGTELLPEIRQLQGRKTIDLVLKFLRRWPDLHPEPQHGEPSYYPRRTRKDDRLDANASLAAQFDRLRVADNDLYPAWFEHRGKRYVLKINPWEGD